MSFLRLFLSYINPLPFCSFLPSLFCLPLFYLFIFIYFLFFFSLPSSAGVYKVPYSSLEGGKSVKSVGKEYQVVRRGKKYHGCWEEYNVNLRKRERGRNFTFPVILRLLGRKSSGGGGRKFWGRISSCRELFTPLLPSRKWVLPSVWGTCSAWRWASRAWPAPPPPGNPAYSSGEVI